MPEETPTKTRSSRNIKASNQAVGRSNQSESFADSLDNVACGPLPDGRHSRIAVLAYLLYERHGRQDGRDIDHWLEAEQQILREEGGPEDRRIPGRA